MSVKPPSINLSIRHFPNVPPVEGRNETFAADFHAPLPKEHRALRCVASSVAMGGIGGFVAGGAGMQAFYSMPFIDQRETFPASFVAGVFGAPVGFVIGTTVGIALGVVRARQILNPNPKPKPSPRPRPRPNSAG